MFCFPTNVEARCWCVVVIIFLHNGSKRVIKGNKSRSREKYVVRGVRVLRASVFIMRVGRFHARVLFILVVSFHPHKNNHTGRDESVSGSSFSSSFKPSNFSPPKKKRILCLGCKICKDFFFSLFFFGKMNVLLFWGGGVSCTKEKERKTQRKNVSVCGKNEHLRECVCLLCSLSMCIKKNSLLSVSRLLSLSLSLLFFYLPTSSFASRAMDFWWWYSVLVFLFLFSLFLSLTLSLRHKYITKRSSPRRRFRRPML